MGLRRSPVRPPAQSRSLESNQAIWWFLKSESNRVDRHQKKKQQTKTLPPLFHSLLLCRYNTLPTYEFFQLHSEFTALPLCSSLLFWTLIEPTKHECCTETEISGTFHLRQSCTGNVEPLSRGQWAAAEGQRAKGSSGAGRGAMGDLPSHAQHIHQNNALAAQQTDHTERSGPHRFETRKITKQ